MEYWNAGMLGRKKTYPTFQHSYLDGFIKSRLTGENRCPVFKMVPDFRRESWIPAFAGMTIALGFAFPIIPLFQYSIIPILILSLLSKLTGIFKHSP
jgi:hypothetical protein